MTRPRVPDDKRQRTARACDSCKRRKQKCNGLHPCNTCIKRSLKCDYTDGRGPHKTAPISISFMNPNNGFEPFTPVGRAFSYTRNPERSCSPRTRANKDSGSGERKPNNINEFSSTSDSDGASQQSMVSETDEEAEVIGQIRMLQDPMKRLLYIGDSSTLSYLQLIRMLVYNSSGSSDFTDDPSRHHILEPVTAISSNPVGPYILPDREVTDLLVHSYFTRGVIELFDRAQLDEYLKTCYLNPLAVDSPTLCLVYLVLAIGLLLSTPASNSAEEAIIKRLGDKPTDQAEALVRAAKCLSDPLNAIENADLWIIQAWILMSVYMLILSKRNAAYAYCGLAVRSAYSLGLHRIRESMMKFDNEKLRRNIWRSLFILDRFLAASLGRPGAIYEEECSNDSLELPNPSLDGSNPDMEEALRSCCLDSLVKSSRSIGQILTKVYLKRQISTRMAQEIVEDCQLWSITAHSSLAAENLFHGEASANTGIGVLHAQLLHYHSIILLARPFFIDILVKTRPTSSSDFEPFNRTFSRGEKFSQACVAASTRSVALIQAAFETKYLPQRNPFVLYFLFSSTLIILSNEYTGLYDNEHFATSISSSITITQYCAESDIQAARMLHILKTFLSDVEKHTKSKVASKPQVPILSEACISDPMEILQSRRESLATRSDVHVRASSDLMQCDFQEKTHLRSATGIQSFDPRPVTRRDSTMSFTTSHRGSVQATASHHGQYPVAAVPVKAEPFGTKYEFGFGGLHDLQSGASSTQARLSIHSSRETPSSQRQELAFQPHNKTYEPYSDHGSSSKPGQPNINTSTTAFGGSAYSPNQGKQP